MISRKSPKRSSKKLYGIIPSVGGVSEESDCPWAWKDSSGNMRKQSRIAERLPVRVLLVLLVGNRITTKCSYITGRPRKADSTETKTTKLATEAL
jgi:hypothetical protein